VMTIRPSVFARQARDGGAGDSRGPSRSVAAAGAGWVALLATSFSTDSPASDSGNAMLDTRVEGVDASCFSSTSWPRSTKNGVLFREFNKAQS